MIQVQNQTKSIHKWYHFQSNYTAIFNLIYNPNLLVWQANDSISVGSTIMWQWYVVTEITSCSYCKFCDTAFDKDTEENTRLQEGVKDCQYLITDS